MTTTRSQAKRAGTISTTPARSTRSAKRKSLVTATKIVSWNMQGSSKDKLSFLRKKLKDPSVSTIVLQEVGDLGGWTNEQMKEEFGVELRVETWSADAGVTGAGNNRCSMAIITRETILKHHRTEAVSEQRRPVLTTDFPTFSVSNVHAPRANGAYIEEAVSMGMINNQHRPAIVVGDMNLSPDRISRLSLPNGTSVISSSQATHISGSELDCAICSDDLNARVIGVEWAGGSDHAVVTYNMDTKP